MRDSSMKALTFPFSYRPGQKELAASVYRTILREKKIFIAGLQSGFSRMQVFSFDVSVTSFIFSPCFAKMRKVSSATVRIQLTYCNIETEALKRFREDYTKEELEEWYSALLREYAKWVSWQYRWGLVRDRHPSHSTS